MLYSSSSYSHVYMGLLSDDICFHVAWSFTSSTDSPFSLKSFLPSHSPIFLLCTSIPTPLATQCSSFTTSTISPPSLLTLLSFSYVLLFPPPLLHSGPPSPLQPFPPFSSHSPIFLLCTSIPTPLAKQCSSFTTSTISPPSLLTLLSFSYVLLFPPPLLHSGPPSPLQPFPPFSSHSPIFLLCTSIPTPLATQWSSFTTSTLSPLLFSFSYLSPMYFYSHPPCYTVVFLHHFNPFLDFLWLV